MTKSSGNFWEKVLSSHRSVTSVVHDAKKFSWILVTFNRDPSSENIDLVHIIDFSIVRWDLIGQIIPTWFGMVFVVSFASCLDVAAISIDMGKPLDTNR